MNTDERDLKQQEMFDTLSSLFGVLESLEENLQRSLEQQRKSVLHFRSSGHPQSEEMAQAAEHVLTRFTEGELVMASRYSLVALVHIHLETLLRKFCSTLQQEQQLPPITFGDLQGSPIDKATVFLTKLAKIHAGTFPEWERLREMQKIRDCIVHSNGYVNESRNKAELSKLAQKQIGVAISSENRLSLSKEYVESRIRDLNMVFLRLFKAAGWPDYGLDDPPPDQR